MIKAIFFDANGVIYYRQENNRFLNEFLQKYHLAIPQQSILEVETNGLQDSALRGQIPHQEFWNGILRFCGVDETMWQEGREVLQRDQSDITIFPGVIETLSTLKERGFKIGVVTDAYISKSTKLEWFNDRGMDVAWDAYANSMDLLTRKPDVRMYKAALNQAKVSPDETVFVGHDIRELDGARQAGLHTVAFKYDTGAEAEYYIDSFDELLSLPLINIGTKG